VSVNILTVLLFFLGSILIISIISRPHLGVIATLVSLPLLDLLPEVPYLSSIIIPIGGATLVGHLLKRINKSDITLFNFNSVYVIGLFLIGWIFASNPSASFFGDTRNWVLTYVQLWILLWLTGELMTSPEIQRVFFWVFSVVSAISSFFAIQQGQIDYTISGSVRSAGISGSPNTAARYFVISLLFFIFLNTYEEKRMLRLLAIVGAVTTFVGVFFTLSRTGILLLFSGLGIHLILSHRKRNITLTMTVFLFSALALWFFSDQIVSILQSIFPSIRQGTDTVGLRYEIWRGGLRMWLEHPIFGVGIGRFPERIAFYSPGLRYEYITAHNTYINMLAETGIIGFLLFMFLLLYAFKNFLSCKTSENIDAVSFRNIWLSVFLVILLGSMTKTDHYDKLLWFLIGISATFCNQKVTE
jgi:O-antigen ligase